MRRLSSLLNIFVLVRVQVVGELGFMYLFVFELYSGCQVFVVILGYRGCFSFSFVFLFFSIVVGLSRVQKLKGWIKEDCRARTEVVN